MKRKLARTGAAAAALRPGRWTSGVVRRVLPNGLTVLVQRDASAPVVAVVTHVRAGYFDEPDEWVGIAHVLEHMFFKGTKRRGPGDLARETQLLGGYLNASTIYDKTTYYTVLPSTHGALARAVDIQSDALMHAALDQAELSRELEVVIQEAKRKRDNPPAVATETLFELLFRVHRMRRWRIGKEDGLRQLDAAALRRYYATRYSPSRTIISLAGDLDPDETLELSERVYGGWKVKASKIAGSPAEPDARHAALRVLHGDIERPLAVLGWRTTAELHPDTPALDMAAAVLGSGRGSWLSRFVRSPGLAAAASAGHYTPTEVGVFDLTIQGQQGQLDEAVSRSLELVDRLADHGPDDAELARVRSLVAVRWSRAFETADGRAASVAEFEALGGYALADQVYDGLMTVTAPDVRRVAATYLTRESVCGVLSLPRDGVSAFETGAWPRAANGGRSQVQSPAIVAPGPVRPAAYGKVQASGEARHFPSRGLDLLVQPKRGAGLVSLGIFVPGLRDEEDELNAGISWLLARSSLRGAAGMNAEELALAAESLGGPISPSVGFDAVGWSITVPAANIGPATRLLRAVALEATLDPAQIEIERGLQSADAARVRDDMYRYPLQKVLSLAFPGDPYGLPGFGTPEGVRQLDAGAIRAWSDGLRSRRAVAVAVGDLEAGELAEGLAGLGDWPGDGTTRRVTVPRLMPLRDAEPRDRAQSALAMAFPGAAIPTPRRFAVEVLGDFLSGLAGRLFQVLREERALAYTVMAAPWAQRRAGAFVTYIATSPEREAEARDAMLETLAAVAGGAAPADEIERARRYAAGQVQIARQAAAAVTGELLGAWINGIMEDLSDLPARLLAVTPEQVVEEAQEIFRSDARAEFVVRGSRTRSGTSRA